MLIALETATKLYMEIMRFRYIYSSDVCCMIEFVQLCFNVQLWILNDNNNLNFFFRLDSVQWTPDTGFQPYIPSE